ncbi:ABC transporter substrate-binding protein [Desulfopila inferna]|uniref:ABC transporter substrate-binding protein n=1 Tax=Desulfopila inferna TaxID=468528 RepID=UPI001963A38A|nr:ABC transporter substrate-binding protein [Desulfopila inferna]MBM9606530.1 ABC transporter substrate-binding protein [Desulfopila inferna]
MRLFRLAAIIISLLSISISGISRATAADSFELLVREAKGTEVKWFMWGGSPTINSWVDTYVVAEVKKRYDIKLKRIPADAAIFINKLLTEKQAGREKGTMDLLWVNGENFKNAKENELLYGPITKVLPNFSLVDPASVAYDFGFPVQGYEAPFGRAQFVFEYDTATVPVPPDSFAALKEWVKENPGKFTYPKPPDFTGSAFIRQAFYALTGGHSQYMEGLDEELYRKNAPKLWEYLNDLKPYLWQQGRTYPRDIGALDTLFERREVLLNMSYHQANAQSRILQGRYPESVRTFVMKEGSLYNTHYTAVPYNAANRAGALVVADFLLSAEAQLHKNEPRNWGDFTVLELNRLDEEMRTRFEELELGEATLPLSSLASAAVPEIPSAYLELLERDWEKLVLRGR